jgi:hypothetical protein
MVEEQELDVLLVGTSGVEIAPFTTRDSSGLIHLAQAWAPCTCWCGIVHQPCARATLGILIGSPQAGVHLDPRTRGLAISPLSQAWDHPEMSEASAPMEDFNPWALNIVRHVVGGLIGEQLICFGLLDIVELLRPAHRFKFTRATSPNGLGGAAVIAGERLALMFPNIHSATIAVVGGPRTTLQEINEAVSEISERLPDADLIFYAPLVTGDAEVSVFGR